MIVYPKPEENGVARRRSAAVNVSHESAKAAPAVHTAGVAYAAANCYPTFLRGGTFRCESMAYQRSQSRCRFSQNSGPVLSASPSANAESALT